MKIKSKVLNDCPPTDVQEDWFDETDLNLFDVGDWSLYVEPPKARQKQQNILELP